MHSELSVSPFTDAYEELWARDAVDLGSRSGEDGESLDDVSRRIRALFEV